MADSTGLGRRAREARERARLTQAEAASAIGIHAQTLSDLERGKQRSVQAATLTAMARAYRVPERWLVEGGENLRAGADSGEGGAAGAGLPSQSPAVRAVVTAWQARLSRFAEVYAADLLRAVAAELAPADAENPLEPPAEGAPANHRPPMVGTGGVMSPRPTAKERKRRA